MAVPAHDERDFAFAKTYGLPIRTVVQPSAEWLAKTGSTIDNLTEAYTDEGTAINSGPFNGLATPEFKQQDHRLARGKRPGKQAVNYKLRDWLFSRQRYWGEPFPILHELDARRPADRRRSKPLSPERIAACGCRSWRITSRRGKPEPPLGKATDWLNVTRNGKRYRRETNTMPQWAGSCWYYLRYIDARKRPGLSATRRRKNTGCRSTSTSAAPNTRCCTCSTRASGTRCSLTAAMSARRSRFSGWSTRA